jgi:hypothetical protein
VVIDEFIAAAILELGNNFNSQASADTISRLRDRVRELPRSVR